MLCRGSWPEQSLLDFGSTNLPMREALIFCSCVGLGFLCVCFFFFFPLIRIEATLQNMNVFWDGPYLLHSAGLLLRPSFQQSSPQLAVTGTAGKLTGACSCTRSDGCTEPVPKVSAFSSRGGRYRWWVAFILWSHQGMLIVNSVPSLVGMLCALWVWSV